VTRRRLLTLSCVAGFAVAAAGCVPRPRTTPDVSQRTVVVLLPDPESGLVGRAVVSNAAGRVELTGARASTTVVRNGAPTAATVLSDADARQLADGALTALPPAPYHVVLNFQFDSGELTDASRALLPGVLLDVRRRPVPEVVIIGHTDTTGSSISNIALGIRRAEQIHKMLIDIGLAPSLIEVESHGEADLLVKTADNVAEPRNRRVEITVR
jgi:outer membrane protein OmpA-like peptidoglycan-associated protein